MTDITNLCRPIIGIENRTAQEAFDIMADRIRAALSRPIDPKAEWEPIGYCSDYGLGKLASRRNYCLSISKVREREYQNPIFSASPSIVAPVGEPLEWTYEAGSEHRPETWRSKSIGREYDIQRTSEGKFDLWADVGSALAVEDTLEAAKAAAQADHESLIRSALNPSAAVYVDQLEKALVPFANDAGIYDNQNIGDCEKSFNDNITIGDLRRARAALAAHPHRQEQR